MVKRILVFPCGSEVGLEIYRSIRYSSHFELIGASSIDDHGRFLYQNYINKVPFHTDEEFITSIKEIIELHQIDAIYPTMDAVAETLQKYALYLSIPIIGSSVKATTICASKLLTYRTLQQIIPIPEIYPSLGDITKFPIFIKPDRGYGSRHTLIAESIAVARSFTSRYATDNMIFLEYLPGPEWTIDCFSDRHGTLLFHSSRLRGRIKNGISVYTKPCDSFKFEFEKWAHAINRVLRPRGAWFFQAKLDAENRPKLLEVAVRLGGSSSLFRCRGINFALLSAYDAFSIDLGIIDNNYSIELDRALENRYKIDLKFDNVFVDLDDCLIIKGEINFKLLNFLYKAFSEGKKLTLITRHYQDPKITLKAYRISELFDRIVHLKSSEESKANYIDDDNAIFIDDSYSERQSVASSRGVAVFSPDMIEALV